MGDKAASYFRPSGPIVMPSKEKIALNESDSSEQVSDLTAMNTARERDIIYDGEQYGDSETQGLANSLDIAVTGQEKTKKSFPTKIGMIIISIKLLIVL